MKVQDEPTVRRCLGLDSSPPGPSPRQGCGGWIGLAFSLIALLLLGAPLAATAGASTSADSIRALREHLTHTGLRRDGDSSLLPGVPPVPPRSLINRARDPLQVAVERSQIGDLHGALYLLLAWQAGELVEAGRNNAASKLPSTRFLAGWLALRLGESGIAVDQFSRIRAGNGPLASWATWYEARAEMDRERYTSAARSCAVYRAQWPEGHHADDCLLLMGESYLEAGSWGAAQKAFADFIELDPEGANVEVARLGQVLAGARSTPGRGIPALQRIALNYLYPTTGVAARAEIDRLSAQGWPARPPDQPESWMPAALSARRSKEKLEAWALFMKVKEAAAEDPAIHAWIAREEEGFASRTGHFKELAALLEQRFQADPDGETLWDLHEALRRGGLWTEAAAVGEQGLRDFPKHGRWRSADLLVARDQMFAEAWPRAVELWDRVASKQIVSSEEATWYGAYCSYKALNLDDASLRMERVVAVGGRRELGARYFRSRIAEAQGRMEDATREQDAILTERPWSWYGLLIAERRAASLEQGSDTTKTISPQRRDGRWSAPTRVELPPVPELPTASPVGPPRQAVDKTSLMGKLQARNPLSLPPDRSVAWGRVRWQPTGATHAPTPSTSRAAQPSRLGIETPPPSYPAGPYLDPARARRTLQQAVNRHKSVLPELESALLLADSGVYHLSGEIVARALSDFEKAREEGRAAEYSSVDLSTEEWRQIVLYSRDHHHASRFLWGLYKNFEEPEQRRATLALAWPLAFPEAIWPAARSLRIDPFILLSLMRQESTYQSWALSSTGAIGLMQVMPSTGALVAKGMSLERYVPRDLEEPSRNILFGAWYFNRLLERFGGSVPLAVASYNAGPQTVHPWISGKLGTLEIEDFVEQIPLEETRNYVLRVMENYATYSAIYAPEGARVTFALRPEHDDPGVVDY